MQTSDNAPERDRARVATMGVLASAALVGSHCIGAVLFAAFGTTFGLLGAVYALEPYRFLFIGLGFTFWGYGFYRLYLGAADSKPAASASGCQQIGSARTFLWFSLCALLTTSVLPTVVAYLAS